MTEDTQTALLILSFGGPEGPKDVMPFLENVTRGKSVPRERLMEVKKQYMHFGGVSPINEQNRRLVDAVRTELAKRGHGIRVYLGNRHSEPFVTDAMKEMVNDGVTRVVAFATSAFGSTSGCRQYIENLEAAHSALGKCAPTIERTRLFYDHPKFIDALTDRVREAAKELSSTPFDVLFTAHSIPESMSAHAPYTEQLREASRWVAWRAGLVNPAVVFQSRSGPPSVPWLGPDILEAIRDRHARGMRAVMIVPVGFVSDHMEVLWDLDIAARRVCDELGVCMVRAGTVGLHPSLVSMIVDLVEERTASRKPASLRPEGPPVTCHPGCCEPR